MGTFKDKTVRREMNWMGKDFINLMKKAIILPKNALKDKEYYIDDACIGYPADDDDLLYKPSENEVVYYFIPRKFVIQTLGFDNACKFLFAHLSKTFNVKWEDRE